MMVALCFFSCRKPLSEEPNLPTNPQDSVVVTPDPVVPQVAYDFTEDLSRARFSSASLIKFGIRVGDKPDSLMQILSSSIGDRTEVETYLVMEYTDTISSADYHYLPACWRDVPAEQDLADTVYQYTRNVLEACIASGGSSTIRYVQLSRCISLGFLWHTEADMLRPSKPLLANDQRSINQASYLKAAIRAIRELCPDAKIVLQTDRVGETDGLHNQLVNLINYWSELGVDYDVLSLYYNPVKHRDAISGLESALSDALFQLCMEESTWSVHLETFYPAEEFPDDYLSSDKVGYNYSSGGQYLYLTAARDVFQSILGNRASCFIYRYGASSDSFQLCPENYLY